MFYYCPLKTDPHRIFLVAGSDSLDYVSDARAHTALLIETKLLINSRISEAKNGAKLMTCDLKDFFLATPMHTAEKMKTHKKYISADIRESYNLDAKLAQDGYTYVQIKRHVWLKTSGNIRV